MQLIDRIGDSAPFDRVSGFMEFMWGPYRYPRWLRRTYILLWPVLMPLRWIGVGAVAIILVLLLIVFAALFEMVSGVVAAGCDLAKTIHEQWT